MSERVRETANGDHWYPEDGHVLLIQPYSGQGQIASRLTRDDLTAMLEKLDEA